MTRAPITGVILAGGGGRRMGGGEKGLMPLCGRPMAEHVRARLAGQVAAVRINANRCQARYRALGVPVDGDRHPGGLGPLAGLASALAHAATDRVLAVPCDAPLLPAVTAQRLAAALDAQGAEVAVARAHGRRQPVFTLMRRHVAGELEAALAAGERRVEGWLARHTVAEADCEDLAAGLANVNTPAELEAVAARLRQGAEPP